jgi:hypothetical protein
VARGGSGVSMRTTIQQRQLPRSRRCWLMLRFSGLRLSRNQVRVCRTGLASERGWNTAMAVRRPLPYLSPAHSPTSQHKLPTRHF